LRSADLRGLLSNRPRKAAHLFVPLLVSSCGVRNSTPRNPLVARLDLSRLSRPLCAGICRTV